jgi:hypothetical protein
MRFLISTLLMLLLVCSGPTSAQVTTIDAPKPIEIKFRDFYRWPIGPRGLEITEVLKRAHDQRIQILGYMVAQENNSVGQFLLTPRPLRTSEDADGDADDLPPNTVAVILPEKDHQQILVHTPGIMKLTGILKVGRHQMHDGRIVWVRLMLEGAPPTNEAKLKALTQ